MIVAYGNAVGQALDVSITLAIAPALRWLWNTIGTFARRMTVVGSILVITVTSTRRLMTVTRPVTAKTGR